MYVYVHMPWNLEYLNVACREALSHRGHLYIRERLPRNPTNSYNKSHRATIFRFDQMRIDSMCYSTNYNQPTH